jgi:DNA excision repair protein ERCC-2
MRFFIEELEVFFPYDLVYREQLEYMTELKHALDAQGDALLEMPTGTGKTISVLALVTSYQHARPETGKLIYCTRTVPEMTKTMEELKRVIAYRDEEVEKDKLKSATTTINTISSTSTTSILSNNSSSSTTSSSSSSSSTLTSTTSTLTVSNPFLGVCLSSRRNLCILPEVMDESDRERVDSGCKRLTASWVKQRREEGRSVKSCSFFDQFDAGGGREESSSVMKGVFDLTDLKEIGQQRGWCPYFLARQAISYARVVVYSYQYMLDPKIASQISKELEANSIIVFDEAHNIDNVCIESMSVSLDRPLLDAASRDLRILDAGVKNMKEKDALKLQEEYSLLVAGYNAGGGGGGGGGGGAPPLGGGGGEEYPAAPVLPADVLAEAMPGSIRNAELFIHFMRSVLRYLRERIKVSAIESATPTAFLSALATDLAIDIRPLRFAYTRLNSLMRTLGGQLGAVSTIDGDGGGEGGGGVGNNANVAEPDLTAIQLVADFCTLCATYPSGFMVILEPFNSKTPHIPDPILQLACLDASIAIKPVFEKYQSVVLTSGTLSPIDMYPRMLSFTPVIRVQLQMSIERPCILPMVVSRGSDQTILTTKFEQRDDIGVLRSYGNLLTSLCSTVPDGVVAFFPSYSYMEMIISAWHAMGVLRQVETTKLLFIETKDIVESTLALTNFKKACDCGRGAVFFSIARGKVAEGIDFDRHYGRLVILFGIPFQYTLSVVLRARLAFLRDTLHIKESDFLTFDAMRQAAQCVGRIIRSKKDYGVIVFADKRYGSADKRSKLPQWVLQFLPDSHLSVAADASVHLTRSFIKSMSQARPLNEGLGKSLLSVTHIEMINEEKKKKGEFAGMGSGGSGGGGGVNGGVISALATASIAVRQQLERQQQFQITSAGCDNDKWQGNADDLLGLAYADDENENEKEKEDDGLLKQILMDDDKIGNDVILGDGTGEQNMIEAAFRSTLRAERSEKTLLFEEGRKMRNENGECDHTDDIERKAKKARI